MFGRNKLLEIEEHSIKNANLYFKFETFEMRKRKSPIAKNLMQNSIAGMFSAIEIHNKPSINYRYEMVALLLLNSWELLLKAYLYKFHKSIKLFHKDGTTKQFENCLNIVHDKIGKDFAPELENLNVLYGYRNQVAHFYIDDLDPIIFSLISKSIIFYSKFLKAHFKYDVSEQSNLILLPIGFKRPMSPIDYISNTSVNQKASTEIKEFLQTIVSATRRLNNNEIDEPIFIDFRMNLTNVNRITNADLIAGIDNTKQNELVITTKKDSKIVTVSTTGEKIVLSRDKSESQGNLLYEELQEGIFDEINNIVDANRLLAKDNSRFMLGDRIYYRIYSERQHVNFNIEIFELLAKTAMLEFYSPFLFWLTKLPAKNIVDLLLNIYEEPKRPKIQNFLKIIHLLGDDAVKLFSKLLEKKYKGILQKPDFYHTFFEIAKNKQTNLILKCLKATSGKVLYDNSTYNDFIMDNNLAKNKLSQECLNYFNEKSNQKSLLKELDYLSYGPLLVNNEIIFQELKARLES